jgi:hypothetical protein
MPLPPSQVLIFSQMVKMIDLIEEFCEFRAYSCERLDGRVRGNERQKVDIYIYIYIMLYAICYMLL